MMRFTFVATLSLSALLPNVVHAAGTPKPVLPLNLTWRPPTPNNSLSKTLDLFDDDVSNKKTIAEFKGAFFRLTKNQGKSDQAKDVVLMRQTAVKLGPRARLLAELVAARVGGGINASGNRFASPTGNWRGHLLAACNLSAKIDDEVHEQTALHALTLWRKIESNDQSWASPPIDIKAQKQFSFFKPVIERQAIHSWSKGASTQALKKYRALSRSLSGTVDGGNIDLRIVEFEGQLYSKEKQLRRWQKVLVEFAAKYQDPQALGQGNETKTQNISANLNRQHRVLIDALIREALPARSSDTDRAAAVKAIDVYISTNISADEKERVRALSGEIHFNAKHHKAAAGIFAALATETQGAKSINYWRKAIRSQSDLASWPNQPPWNEIPKGSSAARAVLLDMFQKTDEDSSPNWDRAANIGLLYVATGQKDEALKYWRTKLEKNATGQQAARAAGWIAETKIKDANWADLESLSRLLVKSRLSAVSGKKTYRPTELLGLALIEGGLEALKTSDYKTAVKKLEEFVKSWRQDPRHDESMYSLALAYHGDHQYRTAVKAMEDFTKQHRRSKFRKDGLKKGGEWTMELAWDDHVMYFLETHAREFPEDPNATDSLTTLSDLYLGRGIYDSAMRVMNSLLQRKDLDADRKADVAGRLLDTAERFASSDTALRTALRLQAMFKSQEIINGTAMSVRARVAAEKGNLRELELLDRDSTSFDQSQAPLAEITSEIKFLRAETLARNQFKEEFFSLGTRDPAAELEKGYALYNKIDQTYKSACLGVRTSWCGPALHRTARIGEQFLKTFDQLAIAKTLDPKVVKGFYARKKFLLESVENQTMEADEKSLEQAKSGATNPDWTTTIMWQNGGDWSREKYTSENADHYIQWRTR